MKVRFSTSADHKSVHGYALKAEVVDPEGMPSGIFVYRAGAPALPGKESVDTFSHVAAPLDMEELPEGEPDLSSGTPYYRRSSAVLWVRASRWLAQLKDSLDADIARLVNDYRLLNDENNYTATETKSYG